MECHFLTLVDNSIKLEDFNLSQRDLEFIKELIDGPLDKEKAGYPYRGRGKCGNSLHVELIILSSYFLGVEKYYLYEVVSNKITGVDVDKVL